MEAEWGNNMALDATRGLPSFSEMLQAFRNRTSLGETLQAGLAGYEKGVGLAAKSKEAASEADLRTAQADEARAKAESLRAGGTKKRVPLAALPESIKPQLAAYVDAEGMVPEEAAKVALGTTEQGRKTESATKELELRQKAFEEQQRSAKEREDMQAQIQALREELGRRGQDITAARAVAETAGKVEPPTLLERGASFIKEGVTGQPLDAVLAERQRQAATQKLSELSGITPNQPMTPAPTRSAPRPAPAPAGNMREQAIKELQAAGAPVTEANIAEAIRQLSGGR